MKDINYVINGVLAVAVVILLMLCNFPARKNQATRTLRVSGDTT